MVPAPPLPRRALYKKLKARSGGFTLWFLGITYALQEKRELKRERVFERIFGGGTYWWHLPVPRDARGDSGRKARDFFVQHISQHKVFSRL